MPQFRYRRNRDVPDVPTSKYKSFNPLLRRCETATTAMFKE